jgi:pimeloyl-ACP methyl ester carboxylesterase
MADDTVGLLDALGIATVDLVGMSMGGMIAQVLAARLPKRIRSLTSIYSTTGNRRVGQPARATLIRMARPSARTPEVAAARHVDSLARLGSPTFSFDPDTERAWAHTVWERGGGRAASAGAARQIAAIQKSGDRTAALNTISVPTLVIHGDLDTMVNPSGGEATAAAIPGAKRVTVKGMRHHLRTVEPDRLARLIVENSRLAGQVG